MNAISTFRNIAEWGLSEMPHSALFVFFVFFVLHQGVYTTLLYCYLVLAVYMHSESPATL